ncbi:translation elongation factor 4, partial [bacterium]|nr:translation elongation factor 4 [bacterium]
IRNFSIIAHIDHGKSTLADRLLEFTKTLPPRKMREQVLDEMELERERGITIKAKAVRLKHKDYILNLIDTPGHVDFSYEVSRSLAACEGVLLVIDASQGVQAQTLANAYLAKEAGLTIIPIINKIDLKNARPKETERQIKDLLGLENPIFTSAKKGMGTEDVLKAIVEGIPPPKGETNKPLQALIFDSIYDSYKGVVVYIRVIQGSVKSGDRIRLMGTGRDFEVSEVGIFSPKMRKVEGLSPGDVGYLTANIKDLRDAKVGDTITSTLNPAQKPLPGYKEVKPFVFASLYPARSEDFGSLRDALTKLKLNDASLSFVEESSLALGLGFRCGFLGLLHMEIVQERLEREYDLDLITMAPSVVYRVTTKEGETKRVENPSKLPSPNEIEEIQEPYIKTIIITPVEYLGPIMQLVQGRRGVYRDTKYLDQNTVSLNYEIPLSEVILDFYDKLKSVSRGYASFDYEHIGYRKTDSVKVNIFLNNEKVEGLSFITHKEKAYYRARELVARLKEAIPQHLFPVAIQGAIGGKVIARETVKALRKDVTAPLYGGDVTRKRKLLEKQKRGKKRMKRIGKVSLPQEAFLSILKVD